MNPVFHLSGGGRSMVCVLGVQVGSSQFQKAQEAHPPFECSQVRARFLLEQEGEEKDQRIDRDKFLMMDHKFQKATEGWGQKGNTWR